MRGWSHLPSDRLLADVSLWSADLGNLETAVRRLSPWADSFHLDAADGHFVPSLLFFPDLIRAIRPHTVVPFHVHLMAEYPSLLAGEFLDAIANLERDLYYIKNMSFGMDTFIMFHAVKSLVLSRGSL